MLILSILAVFSTVVANIAARPVIIITPSGIDSCILPASEFPCNTLRKIIRQQPDADGKTVLGTLLDSLGYFGAKWDSLGPGSFRIVPGSRAVVRAETIVGAPAEATDSLLPVILPAWYDAGAIKKRTNAIARRMAECGYPFALISVSFSQTDSSGITDSLMITFKVTPGRGSLFAAPRLIGADPRNHRLLLRDCSVREGERFDIRKIESSREALGRRPYISSISSGSPGLVNAPAKSARDSTAVVDADYVAVPFLITERSGLSLEGALGISSRQGDETFLQGTMTMSFLNVLHAGEQASLEYQGDRGYQKFDLQVMRPWLFGRPFAISSGFGLEIRERVFGHLAGNTGLVIDLLREWRTGIEVKGSETTIDSSGQSWRYGGISFSLANHRRPLRRGVLESWVSVATGSGIASRERNYSRSHVEFSSGVHLPFFMRQALHARLTTMHLVTDETVLSDAELYRVGGYRSVRGYFEHEFAFRTVVYDQLEYLFYFNPAASVFIFCDNGFGFSGSFSRVRWGEQLWFAGYGLGIRIPGRLGAVTVSWARNSRDSRSLGRLHLQVSNIVTGE